MFFFQVKKNLLKTIDNVLLVDEFIMADMSSTLVTNRYLGFVDTVGAHLMDNVDNFEFSGRNFALGFEDAKNSRSTYIYASKNEAQNKVKVDFDNIRFDDKNTTKAVLKIPESVYQESRLNVEKNTKIISHTFFQDSFFNTPKSKGDIESYIISASLKDIEVKNLVNPIEIEFKINRSIIERRNASCVYWEVGKLFLWK